MSPPLSNTSKRLSVSTLVAIAIIVIAALLPMSTSAIPIPPLDPIPSPLPPSPDHSRMSPKVVFDIVFGLGLFICTIGALLYLASSGSFTGFSRVIDRLCTAFDAARRPLSRFRLTAFFAGAGDAIAGAPDASANASSTRSGSGGVRSTPATSLSTTAQSFGRGWVPAPLPDGSVSTHDPSHLMVAATSA